MHMYNKLIIQKCILMQRELKKTKKKTHTQKKLPPEKELKITVFCETATSVSKC